VETAGLRKKEVGTPQRAFPEDRRREFAALTGNDRSDLKHLNFAGLQAEG
jgi:hypothetical protein